MSSCGLPGHLQFGACFLGEAWLCKDANDIPYKTREFVDQAFFRVLESDRCITAIAGKRLIAVPKRIHAVSGQLLAMALVLWTGCGYLC